MKPLEFSQFALPSARSDSTTRKATMEEDVRFVLTFQAGNTRDFEFVSDNTNLKVHCTFSIVDRQQTINYIYIIYYYIYNIYI